MTWSFRKICSTLRPGWGGCVAADSLAMGDGGLRWTTWALVPLFGMLLTVHHISNPKVTSHSQVKAAICASVALWVAEVVVCDAHGLCTVEGCSWIKAQLLSTCCAKKKIKYCLPYKNVFVYNNMLFMWNIYHFKEPIIQIIHTYVIAVNMWQKTYTMLVPHFSQVWYLLTPATDAFGMGALGESFPGNFKAAPAVKETCINRAAHWMSGMHLSVHHIKIVLFVFTAHCLQSLFVFSTCHHPQDPLSEIGFNTLAIFMSGENVIIWI